MTCTARDNCNNCPIKNFCDDLDIYAEMQMGGINYEILAEIYNKGREDEREKVLKAVIDCGWNCEVHSDKALFEMVEKQLKAGEQK